MSGKTDFKLEWDSSLRATPQRVAASTSIWLREDTSTVPQSTSLSRDNSGGQSIRANLGTLFIKNYAIIDSHKADPNEMFDVNMGYNDEESPLEYIEGSKRARVHPSAIAPKLNQQTNPAHHNETRSPVGVERQ
ncbi:hypothetical protein V6N12_002926 [Hibiscus sabdariffa]|uniref:Uncharacterized protein n=1 Tax=Hibiscus sabdariffa TaxID=183260 RepID=A0ABR2EAT2_9ROSI